MLKKVTSVALKTLAAVPQSKRQLVASALGHLSQIAYSRLQERGFAPNGIVDVGAHHGDWTPEVRRIFPDVPAIMVEAREQERHNLARLCTKFPNVAYVISLLGASPKEAVEFSVAATGSSLFAE